MPAEAELALVPEPATADAAKEQALTAQAKATTLAEEVSTSADELAIELAVEGVTPTTADPVKQAIADAIAHLNTYRDAAKAASDACQGASTQGEALPHWRQAVAASNAAIREYNGLTANVAKAKRVSTVASLDKAAGILVATFVTLTAAFTAVGFAAADYTSFYRNYLGWAIAYLVLAIFAVLVGTFAFLIDAVADNWKLRAEQLFIYLGVVAFGAAFVIAAWGLAIGASSGNDRPQLTASLTTSKTERTTALSATATRSAVSRSHVLVMTFWGFDASQSAFHKLRYDVVGPTASGSIDHSAAVTVRSGSFQTYIVTAVVEAPPKILPSEPPSNCQPVSSSTQPDLGSSCVLVTP
jgi:hypothetical protein